MKAQKWILVNHFDGDPKDSDLQLQEEILPELNDGDVLFEAESLSVDPYMRRFSASLPLGSDMMGEQIAKVKESKHKDYQTGDYYLANVGWRTHTIINMNNETEYRFSRLPDLAGLPVSLGLGILGMPGATAHMGLFNICKAQAGDVVLVNCAAGAVGSVVGQIAKIKGCTVIGSAGSDKKIAWLKELGFDHVFNYKTADLDEAIKKAAPDGVDVYYDNVGGSFSSSVIEHHMKKQGRIVVIGCISGYNATTPINGPLPFLTILMKSLIIEGMGVYDRPKEQWDLAHSELKNWIKEGKLVYKEHVTKGFDNMRSAFYGLFKGENTGKAIVNI